MGRRAELAEVVGLLAARRLVTIAGPGGAGKTRLALEALARLPARRDGTWWVDLGPATEPARVGDVTAAAVGVLVDPAGGPLPALVGHLRDRDLVVCLDNCEHLLDACAELVEALLRTCPGLTVLATSRQPLGVPGETVWRVPPLAEAEAVELFAARARLVRPPTDTTAPTAPGAGPEAGRGEASEASEGGEGGEPVDADAVRTVCRRLDGMPLAIELAAAWSRMLTPLQISAALDDRFRLLVGGPRGVVPRHQTLAASVEWSHDLLRDDARTLLRRLAVFSGGFALDAAEAVCGFGDLAPGDVLYVLGMLVDSSMVVVSDRDGFARYRLLDTIRHYAADRLREAGEHDATRDRHLAHALDLAESVAASLDDGDHDVLLPALEREHDNLRAALDWGLGRPDPTPARRLAAALSHLWLVHGHASEGLAYLRRAVDAAPDDVSELQADLLAGLAMVGIPAGRTDVTDEASRRAMALAEASGGERSLGRACSAAAYVPFYVDYARAEALGRRAQRHAAAGGDAFAADWGLLLEACSMMNRDRHDEALAAAQRLFERSAARNDRLCAAFARSVQMHTYTLTGDVRRAVAVGEEAVRIARPLGDYFTGGTCIANLAWAQGVAGDVAAGRRGIDTVLRSIGGAGRDVDVIGLDLTIGRLLMWDGDLEGGVEWLRRAVGLEARREENWISARAHPHLSGALRRVGRRDEAGAQAERGVAVARALGTPHAEAEALDALAAVRDDLAAAEALVRRALDLRVAHGVWAHVADSLDAVAGLRAAGERVADAARLLAASTAARRRMGYPRLAIDRPDHESLAATVRAGLGDALADARADGERLSLDEAIALATTGPAPPQAPSPSARPAPGAAGARRPAMGWASLTPAERQVVNLVVEGLTNPEIAERLYVSRATVKTHLSHVYAKLGTANRTELAALAAADPDATG